MSGRKRRLVTKDGIDLNQYANQTSTSASTKLTPTIIIDEKSQDHEMGGIKNEKDDSKAVHSEESKKLDKFEIFGLFVANEMKSLTSPALQKKFKRKILECILEIHDEQDGNQST